MDKQLLTTGQLSSELGVSVNSLLRWAKRGLITPVLRTPERGDYRWDLGRVLRELNVTPAQPPAQAADQPQYPAVAVAIVTSRLGVLTGRRNDGRPPWTFIAGKCESGESPADTITREVKEETGLLIRPKHTIGERIHPKTGKHLVYVAAVPATRSRDVFVGDPDELAEVRWLSLAEADALMPDMFPPVREHLARILRGEGRKPS